MRRAHLLARLILALAATARVSGLEVLGVDFAERDKAAHAGAGFAAAYVTSHVLREGTELPLWARWLIGTTSGVALGLALETTGTRDRDDAVATGLGAVVGASTAVSVELILRRDEVAAGIAWRF